MPQRVTDPALLEQLESRRQGQAPAPQQAQGSAPRRVTDPALLEQLEAGRQGRPEQDGGGFMRYANLAGEGLSQGVVNLFNTMVSTPVDVATDYATQGTNAMGWTDDASGTNMAQGLQGITDSLGMTNYIEPEGFTERLVNRAGQEVGAAAIPQAGLTVAGARLAPQLAGQIVSRPSLAGKGGTMGERLSRFFVEPFARHPVMANATESTIAAGGGAGATAAPELLGDNVDPETADLIGLLAGSVGTGAALSTGRSAGRLAAAPFNTEKVARDEAGNRIIDAMTDPQNFTSRVDESLETAAEIPGYQPTTGQASGDPGVLSYEYQRSTGGPGVGAFTQRGRENRKAIASAYDEATPQGDPRSVSSELERVRDLSQGQAQRSVDNAATRRDEAVDAASGGRDPNIARQQQGEDIRSATNASLREAREEEHRLWDAIDPEAKVEVDTVNIPAAARTLIEDTPQARVDEVPEIIRSLADDGGNLIQKQDNIDNVLALRGRITDQMRQARADGDSNQVRQLQKINDEIMGTLEGAANRQGLLSDPDAAARYNDARAYSKELNDRFTRGPAAKVTAKDKSGAYSVPDSGVAARFWKQGEGSPEAIQAFEKAAGGKPQARQALREHALDQALQAAKKGDEIDPQKLKKWVESNSAPLSKFPEVKRELQDVESLERTARMREKRQKLLDDKLTNPKKSTMARYLARDDARASMDSIMQADNPQREAKRLMRMVRNDKDAKYGAQRAFFDLMSDGTPKQPSGVVSNMLDESGNPTMNGTRFRNFLSKNREVAKELFSDNPEHLKRLEKLSRAMEQVQQTGRSKPTGSSGTAAGSREGSIPSMTMAGLVSRGYSMARGVVSPIYVATELGGRLARRGLLKVRQDQFNKLVDEALLNPEIAKTLTMQASKENSKVIARRMRLHLAGISGEEDLETTEPDEIPEGAIVIGANAGNNDKQRKAKRSQ